MDFLNITVGILLIVMGVMMIFVGNYYSRKIGVLHVVIYFMASFVMFAGVLLTFLYGKPSII